jgi:hypothetical protein
MKMMMKMMELLKPLIKLVFVILAIPFSLWLKATVGMSLWGWFVVPLGVPAIGLIHALGLTLVGWFYTTGLDNMKSYKKIMEEKEKDNWKRWFTIQIVMLMVWGYGAIFHWIGV